MTTLRGGAHGEIAGVLAAAGPGLSVVDVHGPGGVGKTWLVRQVLDDVVGPDWLTLRVDASRTRDDLFQLLGQLCPRTLPPPARPQVDPFPHLRQVEVAYGELLQRARAELEARTDAPADLKAGVLAALRLGRRINELSPKSGEYFNVRALGDEDRVAAALDDVARLGSSLRALRSTDLPGPLQAALGWTLAAKVRSDLPGAITDAITVDLEAALVGTAGRKWWWLTERRVPGLDRLLIVLDDWEALAPALQAWVLGSLVPRLAVAPYPAVLVIVGRDALAAMDPGWEQHAARLIKASVTVAPFTRTEAEAWMEAAGVDPARRDELWDRTRGFPFLLDALAQGEPDAMLSLRRFHDRVTRWMSPTEARWLEDVVHLDPIDGDTLAAFFTPAEGEAVLAWFEREASVRDPDATAWRVRPLIREKLLAYQRLRHPSRFDERARRAAGGGPAAVG
jgi:hypothetical protein